MEGLSNQRGIESILKLVSVAQKGPLGPEASGAEAPEYATLNVGAKESV